MFGPLPHINLIRKILKFLNNLRNILKTGFNIGMPWFFFFFDIIMFLRPREAINPFPDIPKESFGYEYVIFTLYRLPKSKDMSKVIYFSSSLISPCFLTFQQTQFFMFTGVNVSSQNVLQVKQT